MEPSGILGFGGESLQSLSAVESGGKVHPFSLSSALSSLNHRLVEVGRELWR